MPEEEFGSSARQDNLILEQAARRSHRSVEKALSEQLKKLRGIFSDVSSVYVSGHPPAGDGEYLHISNYIDDNSPLIRAARTFMYLLPGLFIEGHFCFESAELRKEIYAFCDCLRGCSDPDAPDPFDQFELILNKLLAYFKNVRKALEKGDSIDDNDYSSKVLSSINDLIRLVTSDICKSFVRRESEIRREPGRSYRRPVRTDGANGFNADDRAVLDDIKSSVKLTRTDVSKIKKEAGAALYLQSKGLYGNDPALADFCSINKQTMVDFGYELILGDRDLTAPAAADLAMAHYPNLVGGYKAKYDEDRESLRQRIVRRSRLEGMDLKTNRKYAS